MKKSSFLVTMPVLVLSGLLLSGCGMFRSHKAWDTARQEAPLEIPPDLDTPDTAGAMLPCSGCCQRSKASAPTSCPSPRR